MKNLEDFISENKMLFDSDEPSSNHLQKFKMKLSKHLMPGLNTKFFNPSRIAAAVFIGVILAGSLIFSVSVYNTNKQVTYNENSEIIEVEQYYNSMINANISKLKNANKSSAAVGSVLDDLNEMDTSIQLLKDDLHYHPNNERIMDALVNNYQLKLEITNQVLDITLQTNI